MLPWHALFLYLLVNLVSALKGSTGFLERMSRSLLKYNHGPTEFKLLLDRSLVVRRERWRVFGERPRALAFAYSQ